MKPENLMDAMKYISADYITEAKPNTEQHKESRVKQPDAPSAKKTVLIREDRSAAHGSGKDITMSSKQSFSQRITTGVVAAAACAVFVGGGIFIAQQAKQNRPDPSNSGSNADITEESGRNFLGGTGEIHVAGEMYFMYDDTRFYPINGFFYADRNGALSEMHQNMDADRELLAHLTWDGEQFYTTKGSSVYRLNNDGTLADEPFFSASAYAGSADWESFDTCRITKLTGNYYAVHMEVQKTPGADTSVAYCLYNAETGHTELMPFDVSSCGFIADSDDSVLYYNFEVNGLTRYTFSSKSRKDISFKGCEPAGNEMILRGNTLYCIFRDGAPEDTGGWKYGKVDLTTGECSIIQSAPQEFGEFAAFGDKVFAVTKGGMFLNEADPEWTAPETLCYYDDIKPERFNDIPLNSEPMLYAGAADESFVFVSLACGSDQTRYLIYDRTNGTCSFLYLPDQPGVESGTVVFTTTVISGTQSAGTTVSAVTEAATTTAAELRDPNAFGGCGKIRPVCRNEYSSDYLFRDDEYYYQYLHTEEASWYRFPLEGGRGTPLPKRIGGAQQPDEIITDGTNILTRGLVPVVGGEMYPSLEEIRRMMNQTEHDENDNLSCIGIWEISNRCFMFLRSENPVKQTQCNIFVWVDGSGKILRYSEEPEPWDEFGSCLSDEEHEHMFYCKQAGDGTRRNTITMLPDPGFPAEKPFHAPADLASVGCISGGKTIYIDTENKLCMADEAGNKTVLAEAGTDSNVYVRDDKVYYLASTGDSGAPTNLFMIDLRSDARQPVQIFSTNLYAQFWGFAESNNSAGFEIVLNLDLDSFVFIDPATNAVIRELL